MRRSLYQLKVWTVERLTFLGTLLGRDDNTRNIIDNNLSIIDHTLSLLLKTQMDYDGVEREKWIDN